MTNNQKAKEKEMKISQDRAALIATHNFNSAPQAPKSALRGLKAACM